MMLDPRLVLATFCLYIGVLFWIAISVERRSSAGRSPANNPWVYSLSLAVYCTAWTYYGSVGLAAVSGMLFLPMYLGPSLVIFLWWRVLRKLVRLKTTHRITSIADFISARYAKSQFVAALVTVIAIVGIMPYIALQLKAIISTFAIITVPSIGDPAVDGLTITWTGRHIGLMVIALMVLVTIILGVRRLDPTERHEGMVMALAVECLVKLIAFLAAGIFVTYFMYDGFADVFRRLADSPFRNMISFSGRGASGYVSWISYLILSMSAILFLPRQFHVAVVENHDEKHILTAMWVLPLYMLLISIFVVPIAAAGLLLGYPIHGADIYVLRLPLDHGKPLLSLLVFVGGFSAATGMIMISAVTLSTMFTNHLLLPFIEWVPRLHFLKRHLLRCRWVVVASIILVGYWFEETVRESYMLVNIGLISFAAILQFAPAMLGALFWRRGKKAGAVLGMGAGFFVWSYTLLLPSLVKSVWKGLNSWLESGPWGIELLKPEALFGITGLDPVSHTVLWTMLFNIGLYVLGSVYFEESEEEHNIAETFVGALTVVPQFRHTRSRPAYIDLTVKKREILDLLSQYFSLPEAEVRLKRCLAAAGIQGESKISIVQLVELHSQVEKSLAGSIGAAAAYKAVHQGTIFTLREARELAELYGEILADLRVTPTELKGKIDYYQEREVLLIHQAKELEEKVAELEREITERKKAQEALRESEARYRSLVETMNEGLEIEDDRGVITYVNDRLCQMWGCSREEIIGRSIAQFLDQTQRNLVEQQSEKNRRNEIGFYEASWTGKSERKISTLVSSVPMFDGEGRYRGSFAVITDISHMKALEREKANMISMFAHDMRSSLTGIHGLGLRLLSHPSSMEEEKRVEYLRIINKEAAKLESLVDDFLEFSRLETGSLKLNFRAISLDKELLEIHEAYQAKASQSDITLVLHVDEALPIIEADVNRLRRVFTNLLDNAIKFSKGHGTITLTAQDTNDHVLVRVSDEGIGIDPEELPYIFDLFHRARSGEKREGYGIGLATVKAIVEGHGGRVHVSSELGEGAVFTVFLPKERRS